MRHEAGRCHQLQFTQAKLLGRVSIRCTQHHSIEVKKGLNFSVHDDAGRRGVINEKENDGKKKGAGQEDTIDLQGSNSEGRVGACKT